jgi:GH24 family phage-related lysozyme (muramidase)
MNTDPVIARLKQFEGSVPYMYRCTGGDVTVGVGHAILSPQLAQQLTWQSTLTSIPPTPGRVAADWNRVNAAPKGQLASDYESLTISRMSDDAITALLAADIAQFSADLDNQLPPWNTYPEAAQEALFDMAYNLGIGGLLKFKKCLAACAAGDWTTAAAQSTRLGIPDARNDAIKQLFLSCAQGAPDATADES